MNLDESEKEAESTEPAKKLSRKEKKAKKRAEKLAAKAAKQQETTKTEQSHKDISQNEEPETEAELEPAPVPDIPPVEYNAWEKISPPAKRKKQLATMESGYREVLALVHSMRENQEVLMHSFQKLPEAVDSVKKLADHSAQQSEILSAMNEQLESGSAGKFNETLTSMDKTTQLLLERAQRSEERLYSMLRRAQRRIAFMTLLVLLLFLGTAGAILFLAFPDQTRSWLEDKGLREPQESGMVSPERTGLETASESAADDLFEADAESEIISNDVPSEAGSSALPPKMDVPEDIPTEDSSESEKAEPESLLPEETPSDSEETLEDPPPLPPPAKIETSSVRSGSRARR